MNRSWHRLIPALNALAAVAMLALLAAVFFFAPIERTMGNVQRILYFHVGAAWVAAVAFFIALVGGVMYLRRRDLRWDNLSLASVEIGVVFVTLTIVSGSIWGKPAWNTWWIWSARLTSVTIMWLVYVAYFMLRGAIADSGRRARLAAVYVIVGFVTVVFAYVSIRILRDIHPVVFGGALESAQGGSEGESSFSSGLESARMGMTMTLSTVSFSLLYLAWMAHRIRLAGLLTETARLKRRVAARLTG